MIFPTSIVALVCLATPPLQDGEEGFAHPELLVTTEWLLEHLEDEDVRVVDVRNAQAYRAGHVPLAVHVPTSGTYDPKSRGNIAEGEVIAALFGKAGIDEKAHVVLYDEGKSTSAARVFWTLEVYGHPRVSVVDGGFAKWMAEDLGAEQEVPDVEPVTYEAKPPSARLSTLDAVLEDVEVDGVAIVDSRSDREWSGGRVPGAVHLEWTLNYTDGDVPVFKSPAMLRAMYADQGVTADKRVHGY